MPSKTEFQRAFKLQKRPFSSAGYVMVDNPEIGHVPVQKWQLYHYPISINCKASSGAALRVFFERLVQGERIVYSQYGNPYRCSIRDIVVSRNAQTSNFNIRAKGVARKASDIPKFGCGVVAAKCQE